MYVVYNTVTFNCAEIACVYLQADLSAVNDSLEYQEGDTESDIEVDNGAIKVCLEIVLLFLLKHLGSLHN